MVSNAVMANQYSTVIVFGPTGDVGGAAALEASKRGAKVWLAMRNPEKSINGITKEEEQAGRFERIQADLTDPDSVKKAVQQSGAKAAYLYHVSGMGASIGALKEAGIEYVVFLSSFSIKPDQDLRQIPQHNFIPYMHGQIEVALQDADLPYTALRPAYFATNFLKLNLDTSQKPYKFKHPFPNLRTDCIVPNDIGRVGGAVLVNRPSLASKEVIYLCGPRLINQEEQLNVLNRVLGQNIEFDRQGPQEYRDFMVGRGFPAPVVDYLVDDMSDQKAATWYPDSWEEWTSNIKKYSGYEPTSFEEFAKTQKLD